jgi:hypothetical protein
MNRLLLVVLLLFASFGRDANAQMPVTDLANLAQSIEQVLGQAKDYAQQIKQYEQMLKDYQNQLDQLDAIRGGRGISNLQNAAFDRLNVRRYIPSDWDQVKWLRSGSGHFPEHVRKWAENVDRVRSVFGTRLGYPAFEDQMFDRLENDWVVLYEDQRVTTEAYMAQAITSSELTSDRINTVEGLLFALDDGGDRNDLKRAIDLNTRMSAEIALGMAELNRTMALQSYSRGTDSQRDMRNQILYFRSGQVNE